MDLECYMHVKENVKVLGGTNAANLLNSDTAGSQVN